MRPTPRTAFYRFILLLIFAAMLVYMVQEGWQYVLLRDNFPLGSTIAAVDVSELSREEAAAKISATYNQPIMAVYGTEVVELTPAELGFALDLATMLDEAQAQHDSTPIWQTYLARLIKKPLQPITIPLRATHDPAAVDYFVNLIANMLDHPAKAPQLLTDTGFIQMGESGYTTDMAATAALITTKLYQPDGRTANFVVSEQPAPALNMDFLRTHLEEQLRGFDGTGSLYILDLQTGEELAINADAAISGLSIVKVAIMIETFRAVDGPLDSDAKKLLDQTAIVSGNYSANLLLDIVAGQDNAYLGVDILTESMHRLGLINTFMATPYEEQPRPGKSSYVTPANQRTDINLDPDPAMQTTAEEMGQLLAMIYDCSHNGGALLALYPEQLTAAECQLLLDTMSLNTEGNLIRYGVPENVHVAHKHGWAYNTHGDAGIVFSPGGDYVIVQYLHQDSDWLNANVSFAILRELSRSVYNYFNPDQPYVDHKRGQKGAGKRAMELILAELSAGTLPPYAPPEPVPSE